MKKQTGRKLLKISLLILVFFIAIILSIYSFYYFTNSFDKNKLAVINNNAEFFDSQENIMRENSTINSNFVSIKSLPEYVPMAFVSQEDKKFYKHNGIDIKRLIGATFVNVKNGKFKQGGSTISQQLIKNTHLGSERTLERKFKEIALTKQMEKVLSKDEILENYLNIIYFGNNCYGIENASNYYFSKSAKELTENEVASLVAIISAPSYYAPTSNFDKNNKRKILVLKSMLNNNVIDIEKYNECVANNIKLNISKTFSDKLNTYSECALDEAEQILGLSGECIARNGYKIHTYLDIIKQNNLIESIKKNASSIGQNDYESIVLSPQNYCVEAYAGKSAYKLNSLKRQPGSAIKPCLVYASAIENNIISPASIILDEEIDISGYKPKNVGGNTYGYVSAREALSRSLNIPAVKILSYTGIEKSKDFAKNFGVEFDKNDTGYAIALGGFTNGITLKTLASTYVPLANSGLYDDFVFVKYITDKNGKIVYRHKATNRRVCRDDTSYLVSDMLQTTSKYGTAKKLSNLGFDVCAKTGTVGNSTGNSDAYAIAYTTDCVIASWIGNATNGEKHNISGGGLPCIIDSNFLSESYKNKKPKPLSMPDSCEKIDIDLLDIKEKNSVSKANSFTPDRYKTTEIFSKNNTPKIISTNFINIVAPTLSYNNGDICFNTKDYIKYELYQKLDDKIFVLIKEYSGLNDEISFSIDKNLANKQSYYLIAKITNFANDVEVISEKSNIIELDFSVKTPVDTSNAKKWYL